MKTCPWCGSKENDKLNDKELRYPNLAILFKCGSRLNHIGPNGLIAAKFCEATRK